MHVYPQTQFSLNIFYKDGHISGRQWISDNFYLIPMSQDTEKNLLNQCLPDELFEQHGIPKDIDIF